MGLSLGVFVVRLATSLAELTRTLEVNTTMRGGSMTSHKSGLVIFIVRDVFGAFSCHEIYSIPEIMVFYFIV